MESIGVSSFALNHNKKSSPARLNMRLPSPKADIKPVAQLYQLGGKSQQYQRRHSESLHYTTSAGGRTAWLGAAMRGGGCGGRSSLSCWTSIFLSAVSSVEGLRVKMRPPGVG